MNDAAAERTSNGLVSSELAQIFGQLTDELWHNAALSDEAILARFPEQADELRELLPTFRAVAALQNGPSTSDKNSVFGYSLAADQLTTLGDYRIVREVGRGGMGVVYEAQQMSLDRHVALKVLPFASLADDQQLRRFKNEARAAATLIHPHIVPVYAVGCERGVHYYSMQFIEGPSLADVLKQLKTRRPADDLPKTSIGPSGGTAKTRLIGGSNCNIESGETHSTIGAELSTQRDRSPNSYIGTVANWGAQAAQALAYAHENGVLHRDIKPGNLLLDRAGNLWITDFGLARIEADAGMTMTGDIVGTLRYMAPEQALAKRAVIDYRADIYSLGATLYELLTLQPPFAETDRAQLLKLIAFQDPTPPRKLDRHIPLELETIILKAMAKQPEDRYQTAQLMVEDLWAVLEHRPIRAKRPTMWQRANKLARRHPVAMWATIAALMAISSVLFISQIRIGQVNRHLIVAKAEAEQAIGREAAAANKATLAQQRSNELLFAADIRLAGVALSNNNVAEARERLARHIPAVGELDRRGFAWHYLWSKLNQEEMILHGHGGVFDVEFSPDGQLIALSHDSGEVTLHSLSTGEKTITFQGQLTVSEVARQIDFSRDGKLLAARFDNGKVLVWNVEDERLCASFEAHRGIGDIAFHPDGELLATIGDRFVELYRIQQHGAGSKSIAVEPVTRFGPMPGVIYTVDISHDGQWLAVGGGIDGSHDAHGLVTIWNSKTASVHDKLELAQKVYSVSFANTNEHLAVGSGSGDIVVWDCINSKQIAEWSYHTGFVYDLAFSSDDAFVVSASKDSTACLWRLNRAEPVRILRGHSHRVYGAAVSPTSGRIATASADGTVKVWRPQATLFSMRPLDKYVSNVRLQADGHRVITSSGHGFSNWHDLASDNHVVLPSFQPGVNGVSWQQNGSRFVLSGQRDIAPLVTEVREVETSAEVAVADLDGDGDEDRLAAFERPQSIIWEENLGGQQWAAPRLHRLTTSVTTALADVDADNKNEVLAPSTTGMILILNPDDFSQLRREIDLLLGFAAPGSLACADLDADSDLDVVTATQASNTVAYYTRSDTTSDTTARFDSPRILASDLERASDVVTADFNGDGNVDVLACGADDDRIMLFKNLGAGRFSSEVLTGPVVGPKLLNTADVNADGICDVMVATTQEVLWYRNEGASFAAPSKVETLDGASWLRALPKSVVIYDAQTQQVEHSIASIGGTYGRTALSPDGGQLAVVDWNHIVRIWRLPSEQLIQTIPTGINEIWDLVYSPDGKYLLAAKGDNLRIWNSATYELLHDLKEHDNTLRRVIVSSDSKTVVTLSDDLTVRVWSLPEGRQERVLVGHKAVPSAAAFSPDDRTLATGSKDGSIIIWDLATGQELHTLGDAAGAENRSIDRILDLAFRDEKTLVAVVYDDAYTGSFLAEWRAEEVAIDSDGLDSP